MTPKKLTLKKPAALGSVEWVETHWDGVQLGVKHVDAVTSRDWSSQVTSVHYDEQKRLNALRKEMGAEDAPPSTQQGRAEFFKLFDECLDAVAGMRGVDDLKDDDADGAREILRRASYGEAQAILSCILEVQQVSKFRSDSSTDAGDVGAE